MDSQESVVRWQSITIAQLTYAVNLVLGLTIASLGFAVTLLANEDFAPVSWQKWVFSLASLSLLVSTGLGIWCVINRLRDFRLTTDIARKRSKSSSEDDITDKRKKSRGLGNTSWRLFRCQIVAFGIGVFFLVTSIAGVYVAKLF